MLQKPKTITPDVLNRQRHQRHVKAEKVHLASGYVAWLASLVLGVIKWGRCQRCGRVLWWSVSVLLFGGGRGVSVLWSEQDWWGSCVSWSDERGLCTARVELCEWEDGYWIMSCKRWSKKWPWPVFTVLSSYLFRRTDTSDANSGTPIYGHAISSRDSEY
jgi:hypothetical protein